MIYLGPRAPPSQHFTVKREESLKNHAEGFHCPILEVTLAISVHMSLARASHMTLPNCTKAGEEGTEVQALLSNNWEVFLRKLHLI